VSVLNKVKLALESASTIAKNIAEGNDIKVEDNVKETRLYLCSICPSLENLAGQMQCGECGCFLKVKAGLEGMKCPLGKW
jgi:hypothetical protein